MNNKGLSAGNSFAPFLTNAEFSRNFAFNPPFRCMAVVIYI